MSDNELAVLGFTESTIAQIVDGESAREAVKKLKTLESMLKAAEKFREQARKYAMLEVAVYKKIFDEGLLAEIPRNSNQRRVISWLVDIPEKDRENILDYCGENGITVEEFWNVRVKERAYQRRAISTARASAKKAVDEFRKYGHVNLEPYFSYISAKHVPSEVATGLKEEVRHTIRRLGGHGVGDGDGMYVTPGESDQVAYDVLMNKAKSILKDVNRMREFNRTADALPYAPLKLYSNFNHTLDDESIIGIMFILFGVAKPDIHFQALSTKIDVYCWILEKLGTSWAELTMNMIREGYDLKAILNEYCDISEGVAV